ncbi:MAG TPA: cytochrome c oxidase subunit II [Woeseiaceae bacterium]|nr:cytochrome c oxidase subunit II [Woeseiaceae bacterium]
MNLAEWLGRLSFWPEQVSKHAVSVDNVLIAFTLVMVMFTAPVFIAMTWFAIRYRKGSPASRAGRPRGSPWVETAWAAVPLAVMAVFFVRSANSYIDLNVDARDALQIDVIAKQWMWKFRHPTGRRQINQLNVPVDTPVELTMTSQDVIHSLFLPALRIKQDVLPGRKTRLRFVAKRTGTFHLTCAEYCGTLHSRMGGSLVVMTRANYEVWARGEAPPVVGKDTR